MQTSNNLTTSQTLTTSEETSSGDTLLVIYATDNSAITSNPTTTAGTLTQYGTTVNDGNGNGVLNIYSVPITSDGSQDVIIPAAGGYDVFGIAVVLKSYVELEGFTKTSVTSSTSSFTTPAATFEGNLDMLVAATFNLQGASFDLSTSGLAQQANPEAMPYSAISLGTATMTGPGATPTYNFTSSSVAKPGMVVFGLQKIT